MAPVILSREQELEAFAAGDFDLLILSMVPLANKVATGIAKSCGYDFEEASSLAMVSLCASVRKFDPTLGHRLSTFVWRCVSSYVRRAISRENDRRVEVAEFDESTDFPAHPHEEAPCWREEKKKYWNAIQVLPSRDREVLERRRRGQTHRQICAETGIGRNQIAGVINQAVENVRLQCARRSKASSKALVDAF